MSHYLITKARLAPGGTVTGVAIHKLAPDPRGNAVVGVGPELLMDSARVAGWIAGGDVVYVGAKNPANGAFEIGDEVRPAGRRGEVLESCNVDGARTEALRRLPPLPGS